MKCTIIGSVKAPKSFCYHAIYESKCTNVAGFLTLTFLSKREHELDDEVHLYAKLVDGKYYYYERT